MQKVLLRCLSGICLRSFKKGRVSIWWRPLMIFASNVFLCLSLGCWFSSVMRFLYARCRMNIKLWSSQWVVMGIWRFGSHSSSLSSRASCRVGAFWICLVNGGMCVVMIATCCWWTGHGLGEVWVSLFTRAIGPGVGGRGGSMGTGCGSSSSLKGE